MGLNPAIYWMDVSNCNFNEKGNKGSQMGQTKKKIYFFCFLQKILFTVHKMIRCIFYWD
jgi:hypothetical protein